MMVKLLMFIARCQPFSQAFVDKHAGNSLRAQLFLTQVLCNQGRLAEALKLLQSIDAVAHKIGTVATLVGMYDELGDKQGAMKVFDSAIKFWEGKVRCGLPMLVSLVVFLSGLVSVMRDIARQRPSRHPTIFCL